MRTDKHVSRRRSRAAVAVVALAATTFLAACGGSSETSAADCQVGPQDDAGWQETVDTALAQGQVSLFEVYAPEQVERVTEAFSKACPGIELVATHGASDLLAQVEAQVSSGSGGADVFVWGDRSWYERNADALVDLTVADFPEEGWTVPAKAGTSLTFPVGFLVWNSEEFPEGFENFEDLTATTLQGRFGTREDLTGDYIGFLNHLEQSYGDQYLRDLGDLEPRFYPSVVPMAQAVASGEIGVANYSLPAVVKQLQAAGAPLDYAIPDDAWWVEVPAAALSSGENPEAGEVLVTFLLSEDGQEALNGEELGASYLDIDNDLAPGDAAEIFNPADVTEDLRADWESKFDSYLR